jgi:hypothetical protein
MSLVLLPRGVELLGIAALVLGVGSLLSIIGLPLAGALFWLLLGFDPRAKQLPGEFFWAATGLLPWGLASRRGYAGPRWGAQPTRLRCLW